MRLLFVADIYPSRDFPAANTFIQAQAKALQRQGCEIAVLSPTPYLPEFLRHRWAPATLPEDEIQDGIRVLRPRFLRPPGSWFRRFAALSMAVAGKGSLQALNAAWRPDALVAHMAVPTGAAAMLWARRFGLPYFVTVHGLDVTQHPQSSPALMRQTVAVLRDAAGVVCVSDYLRAVAGRIAARPADAVHVGYLGCDTAQFRFSAAGRESWRRIAGIEPSRVVVGYLGRIEAEKGMLELLAAQARLPAETRPMLCLVGTGQGEAAVLDAIWEYGLAGSVRLLPPLAPAQVPDFLSACDMLALPSHEEGFGLVLIEAQSTGLPVIAGLQGGMPEAVLRNGGNILVRPGDTEALSVALGCATLEDRNGTAAMARRQFVTEHFNADAHAAQLVNFYRRRLADKSTV
jgi:teichuronic acid biosynthesis glycosyltransferase TuaC